MKEEAGGAGAAEEERAPEEDGARATAASPARAAAGEVVIAGTAGVEAIEIGLSSTALVITIPLRLPTAGGLLGSGILLLIYLGCRACGSSGGGEAGMRRLRDAADAADAAKEAAGAVATGAGRMGNPPEPRALPAQAPAAEQGFGRGGEVTREIAPYPRPRR